MIDFRKERELCEELFFIARVMFDSRSQGYAPRSGNESFKRSYEMSKEPSTIKKTFGDFAPKLVELTDNVLFADIWERPSLSKRDRSLVTVAALIAMNRTEQLRFHIPNALKNGVTKDQLIEVITHLAFYTGWPNAMSAVQLAKELLTNADAAQLTES